MKDNIMISKVIIKKIEELAHLQVSEKESDYFLKQFNETLAVIDDLNKLDTKNTNTTNQVTGLTNIYREDVIDKERILSQNEALSNSRSTYKGFFMVKAIFK